MEMKNLGNLSPAKGSNKKKKRLGRGIGSGLGKTSGKGHKGQTARKGGGIRPGFEGGQTPLYRRLPKRGFFNIFRTEFNIVNLSDLKKLSGSDVNKETLAKAGLIRNPEHPIKLLGKGEVSGSVQVTVDKASKSAIAAVEKAGGKVELIAAKTNKLLRTKKKK
jgi:large subunit ribosomal protein L15